MTTAVSTPAPPRGGRDLKSAVLVGVGLLVLALVGLVWLDWLLVLLVVALLVGADQRWLSTTGFLDKVAENLEKSLAA